MRIAKLKLKDINILLFIILSLLTMTCEREREWKNPYDTTVSFSAPSNLDIYELYAGVFRLDWQDNSDFEDGFVLERKIEFGNFETIFTAEANETSFIDTDVEGNLVYRVFAFKGERNSGYSNTITEFHMFYPSDLNITISGNLATLEWNDNTNFEDRYVIRISSPCAPPQGHMTQIIFRQILLIIYWNLMGLAVPYPRVTTLG